MDNNNNSQPNSGAVSGTTGPFTVVLPTTQAGAANGGTWTISYPTYTSYIGSNYIITSPPIEQTVPKEKAKDSAGCTCRKCKEYNEYAEANQEDGSFICYPCRKGW